MIRTLTLSPHGPGLHEITREVQAEVRASGLEEVLEDEGWQSGEYVSCTLRYSRAIRIVGPVAVTSVFGRYSAGQLPTDSTGRDAFSAGLEIGSP